MSFELKWDDVVKTPVAHYTRLLADKTPFAFSRWGDGECKALTGAQGRNCDGHAYFSAMGAELAGVLRSKPPYYLGMQPLALRQYAHRVNPFLEANGLTDLVWHDSDVFHWAVSHEEHRAEWLGFLAALRGRRVMVIGPRHLRDATARLFGWAQFIDVPERDCYKAMAHTADYASSFLDPWPEPMAVLLSCSMPAEILLDRLYRRHGRHAFLDMGSVWDPYAGVHSRNYMKNLARGGWTPPA